jgi:signal peptidase II
VKVLKKNFYYLLLIFFLFSIDRITKYLIVTSSSLSESLVIEITSFLNFNLIWNDGIAFGLLSFHDGIYYNTLTVIIIIIITVLIYLLNSSNNNEKFGFSLIIGGSLGNVYDRLYYRSVIDFIDLHINDIHWFIFNVADIFITIGILIIITLEFFKKND